MSQELYIVEGVVCPQCVRLRTVNFYAKKRSQGEILLGTVSIEARKIVLEMLKTRCSYCDGSYTAKDELNCRIGTRVASAIDSLRPAKIKERDLTGWDATLEGINNGSISPESALKIAGITEAPHYQGVNGCACEKCIEQAYSLAMNRCGLGFYSQDQVETPISNEYVLWSQARMPKKQGKYQEEIGR